MWSAKWSKHVVKTPQNRKLLSGAKQKEILQLITAF
jgi:hypothetical protein